jgi:hypothetical protein
MLLLSAGGGVVSKEKKKTHQRLCVTERRKGDEMLYIRNSIGC